MFRTVTDSERGLIANELIPRGLSFVLDAERSVPSIAESEMHAYALCRDPKGFLRIAELGLDAHGGYTLLRVLDATVSNVIYMNCVGQGREEEFCASGADSYPETGAYDVTTFDGGAVAHLADPRVARTLADVYGMRHAVSLDIYDELLPDATGTRTLDLGDVMDAPMELLHESISHFAVSVGSGGSRCIVVVPKSRWNDCLLLAEAGWVPDTEANRALVRHLAAHGMPRGSAVVEGYGDLSDDALSWLESTLVEHGGDDDR